MKTMNPKAKNSKILIQEVENEVLIYDLTNNKVFNLNTTAALVWQSCDGSNSVETISENTNFPINLILLTIDELQKYNLFEEEFVTNLPTDKTNRRKLLMQFATTAIVFPAIVTIVAPKAINAQSGCVNPKPIEVFNPASATCLECPPLSAVDPSGKLIVCCEGSTAQFLDCDPAVCIYGCGK
jgi:hypothetical protein